MGMEHDEDIDSFFFKSPSAFRLSSEVFFSIFSPGHVSFDVSQKPSSLPSNGQTFYQGSVASWPNEPEHSLTILVDYPQSKPPSRFKQDEGASQTTRVKPASPCSVAQKEPLKNFKVATDDEKELVQSSVVPWPVPPSTNTARIHGDTKHSNIHTDTNLNKINSDTKMAERSTDSHRIIEMMDDEDTSHSSLNTHNTNSKSRHTQTHTPVLDQLTKDQQLQEEERLLLAKIHMMTGDTSPVFGPRNMKRLIPDPHEIDCDVTELADHREHSIIPCFDTLEEIPLTDAEEPLANELGQNQEEEDV